MQVRNVSRRFGSLVAVDDVSLTIEPGELRAIIGPNGAGKTTFFNLISGFFPPDLGRILFEGRDITGAGSRASACGAAWRAPSRSPKSFPNSASPTICASRSKWRPASDAMLARRRAGAAIEARVDELLELGDLAAKRDSHVGALSHGDQRATEIMMALALRPRLLMLDEPTAGMGDQETYDIARLIRRLHRSEGLSIMLIEHDMRVVFNLADRIMVLAEGKVLAEGRPDEIAGSEAVQAAYLGRPPHDRARAEGLQTFYGKSHILHGVTLEVREGEIVALLGRNGAGKTTTLRSLIGLMTPREGNGRDLRRPTRRASRPTGSPRWASATCPRGGASSPT